MQNWVDDKLQWNASSYENVTEVALQPWEFWSPNLELVNAADRNVDGLLHTTMKASENGSVYYPTNFQWTAFCAMDHRSWPYDSHTCRFEFEGRFTARMKLETKYFQGSDFTADLINGEWNVNSVQFGNDPRKSRRGDLNAFVLELHVTRRSQGYFVTLFAPVLVIIILTLSGFWLPVQAGEKILVNGVVGILVNMYMLHFANKLPSMGLHTPLVVRFCVVTLYLVMISMAISIVVLAISRTKHVYSTPWTVKRILESSFGRWLLLRNVWSSEAEEGGTGEASTSSFDVRFGLEEEERDGEEEVDVDEVISDTRERVPAKMRNSVQEDWILLATAIDRIAFIVYSLIFIVIAVDLFVVEILW